MKPEPIVSKAVAACLFVALVGAMGMALGAAGAVISFALSKG